MRLPSMLKPDHKLRIADLGLLMVYGLCRLLPLSWVSGFGAWRGRYRGAQLAELEARARQNLAEIAPGADPAVVLPRLRAESGRALLEVLIADRLAWSGRIRFERNKALADIESSDRSIVFALIHQCNLGDVAGAGIGQAFSRVKQRFVVTREIQNRTMRSMVNRTRHQSMKGMAGLISGPAHGLARGMLRALTEHWPSIALLHVDEARNHQVAFPGFGVTLPEKGLNAHYAIRLARRSGACLVPVALTRDADCPTRFCLRALAVWDLAQDARDDRAVLTAMSAIFEQEILKDPSRWLNIYHRRPTATNA